MSAHCSEVLSPSADLPGVRFLRIVERVEGFILQRFDERGDSLGDLQFETLDEAMRHVYSEYRATVAGALRSVLCPSLPRAAHFEDGREAVRLMANHDPKLSIIDDDVLESVNEAMIEIHERYHGRKPRSARTQMMGDDLLACLLADVYTDIEKTMIELQRQALVHQTRSAFQQAMEHRFIAQVERLTGRRVLRFISTHHVGPDLELELFVLEP